MKLFLLLSISLTLLACSSQEKELIDHITAAKLTADSIAKELQALDPSKAAEWYEESVYWREQVITSQADTIPLEFAADFDRYFMSMDAIARFPVFHANCKNAADSLSIRLALLQKDIEAQSGDRAQYKNFVNFELKEAQQLRKHAAILTRLYTTAETAQAQFLPPIERFIRTFVEK